MVKTQTGLEGDIELRADDGTLVGACYGQRLTNTDNLELACARLLDRLGAERIPEDCKLTITLRGELGS